MNTPTLTTEDLKGNRTLPLLTYNSVIGTIAAMAAAISILWAVTHPGSLDCIKSLVAGWSILPPIFFFVEFHWVRARCTAETLQRCKDSEEFASKIWAGVVAALSVLYLKG